MLYKIFAFEFIRRKHVFWWNCTKCFSYRQQLPWEVVKRVEAVVLKGGNADDWFRSEMVDAVYKLVAAVPKDVVDETLSVEMFASVIVEDTEEESGVVGGAVVTKDTVEVVGTSLVGVVAVADAVGVVWASLVELIVEDAVEVVGLSEVAAVVVEVTLWEVG